MRFLADENVSHYVVERLRAAGFDVAATGLTNPGASDSDVRQRLEVQGVVLLELDRLSNVAEADRVVSVVSTNVDKQSGNLLVIEPGRARIRPLRR